MTFFDNKSRSVELGGMAGCRGHSEASKPCPLPTRRHWGPDLDTRGATAVKMRERPCGPTVNPPPLPCQLRGVPPSSSDRAFASANSRQNVDLFVQRPWPSAANTTNPTFAQAASQGACIPRRVATCLVACAPPATCTSRDTNVVSMQPPNFCHQVRHTWVATLNNLRQSCAPGSSSIMLGGGHGRRGDIHSKHRRARGGGATTSGETHAIKHRDTPRGW